MKKIAIRFGDNDFINTFMPLLRALAEPIKYNDRFPKDKEGLVRIIQELSFGMYLAHQAWEDTSQERQEHTKRYLMERVTLDRVLVDEEVDEYLRGITWDNSETYILDMTQHTPYIYSL